MSVRLTLDILSHIFVTGEYGFVTADGMYHETAYGTDKNDNFVVTRTRYGRIKTRKCLTFFPKNIIIIIIIILFLYEFK